MHYLSTRGGDDPLLFRATVLTGLARDGGLFLPSDIPDVRDRLTAWARLSYADLAYEIMRLYADDIPAPALRAMVDRSYAVFRHPEVTPVVAVGNVHVLELFHGPTLAFKDVALQFLGNLFEYMLAETSGELNIVAATSGDTGSAAIHGVRGRDRMRIFVLHPQGRVSPVQERQMTSVLDANVHNLAVAGTFDDCQNLVKALFNDLAFRDRHHLGAVNSINWARVLAQITYYFYAAFRVMERTGTARVRFSVPTGNFGDIFAGYVACRMGLPCDRLVLATNENDILTRFFQTGVYGTGPVRPTLSPSMDIQVASNFERYLYYRAGGNARQVAAWMTSFAQSGKLELPAGDEWIVAGRGDTPATLATIRNYWTQHHYLLDPHSAVGVYVGEQHLDAAAPMICLATAHPAKFGEAICQATGKDLAHHPILDALATLPTRCTPLPADRAALASFVAEKIRNV
ncbi:MAG: threonine synthase [Kiritimatiellia bacterium]